MRSTKRSATGSSRFFAAARVKSSPSIVRSTSPSARVWPPARAPSPPPMCAVLPFADGAFDLVVSNSTLDHFRTPADIQTSFAELHRVLAPGGSLILTLDNPSNPVVALQKLLAVCRSFGACGSSRTTSASRATPREAPSCSTEAVFTVRDQTAILHCPRARRRLPRPPPSTRLNSSLPAAHVSSRRGGV